MDRLQLNELSDNLCGIYKIVSPSGKLYIGQSRNIKNRYRAHLYSNNNTKLNRSFKKYGLDSHIFEILNICSINQLSDLEELYIKKFDTINSGLNTIDKNYTLIHTSNCKNNYKWTNDRKKLHSNFIKNWWIDNRDVALKKRNFEWKSKIGNKNKNKVVAKDSNGNFIQVTKEEFQKRNDLVGTTSNLEQPKLKKRIKCITDDIIFNSLKEASKYYNLTSANISTSVYTNKPIGMIKHKRELYFQYI